MPEVVHPTSKMGGNGAGLDSFGPVQSAAQIARERHIAYLIFSVAMGAQGVAQFIRQFSLFDENFYTLLTAISATLLLVTSYYIVRLLAPMRSVRVLMLVGVGFVVLWAALSMLSRIEPTANWRIFESGNPVRAALAVICNVGAFSSLVLGFFMSLLYARQTNAVLIGERHGLIREMEERERAEDALRASEARYKSLFDSSPIAIIEADYSAVKARFDDLRRESTTDLGSLFAAHPEEVQHLCSLIKLRDFNVALLRMIQADNPEEIQRDFTQYFTADALSIFGREFVKLFNGGTLLSYEFPIANAKRRPMWVMINMAIPPGHEETFDTVLISLADETERKLAEENLRRSERRFRGYFDLPLIGIAVSSPGKEWLHVNDRFCEMLGFSRRELIGKPWTSMIHPEDLDANLAHFNRVLAGNEDGFRFEKRFVRKDGNIIWVDLAARCLRNSDGTADTFLTVVQDITERRRAEHDRLELERQIQQSQRLESLGVLAGGIAHDFNNILMAILGYADMALSEIPPESGARASLQEIEHASRRAAELCRQMLAYSGRGKFVVELMDLRVLIEEMVHLLKTSISKKASLNLNFSDVRTVLHGDVTQIRQVIMNLVVNASEALGETAGTIAVSTALRDCTSEDLSACLLGGELTAGRYVCLEVADTGSGMSEETLRRVFEPFFTTKFTGRGLGMAAVLGIVRGHKGALSVSSQLGKGTTFRLYFPAVDAPQISVGCEQRHPGQESKLCGHVLLVDDEVSIRELGKKMLERMGLSVSTAVDGAEALEVYARQHGDVDVVMLDLTMPRMGGEETLEFLRKIDPHVPVVICSGYTEHEIAKRFAGNAPEGFIQKPYNLATLKEQLIAVIGSGHRH